MAAVLHENRQSQGHPGDPTNLMTRLACAQNTEGFDKTIQATGIENTMFAKCLNCLQAQLAYVPYHGSNLLESVNDLAPSLGQLQVEEMDMQFRQASPRIQP